ncbi:RelA/SpoT family protein [Williamsoniiplasma luminosum]|uniref:Penta-phosphate guanosine-3'-pyrophosphohydrolase n=1 Tax=Williamsoniiplasma luminosum TaxID=214888 RepID=A0A2S0NJH6_9MOLU|nr:RelA/SpoT family protein [Williamsoniiplasma luminosum]AVP49159.1 MAG: bifunctional (p)ppGpp synthetase/guanosine-3',5'-bis(diphosphate) 3'-pyrophosphohydrolase [Williamsoniiplasma luminosum]
MALISINRTKWTRKKLDIVQIEQFEQLNRILLTYISSKKDLKAIKDAYIFAELNHKGQKRKNNDPYIYHPLSTAYYLAQFKMGPKTIIAGLLHDILEDTPITAPMLANKFGEEVAGLVEAITKVSYFAKENREQQKGEYLRKIYLSMAKDIRVIIIKFADRLHNMLTIENLSKEKQQIIAKETLETYSSIAHRIGMKQVKTALEDMSFQILNPEEYNKIQELMKTNEVQRYETINHLMIEIESYLRKEKHIKIVDIFGRPKTIYSVYRKMHQFNHSFEDLKDLLAIRIIAKSNDDCYKILGFLHNKYTPLAGRFKDYIATPKNGVYQSLHTTLSDHFGNIFEVQIRTEGMDDIAETGAAAHWAYKTDEKIDINKKQKEIDEKIDIFKRIIDLDQSSGNDNQEENIEKVLKQDFFTEMIYILTPDKKIISLPFGSTVLDFAYRIHTEVGQHAMGAKIDGIFYPINTILNSGQLVEIKTSSKQHPTHEWLKMVQTSNARNRIKKYLISEMKEANIKDKKDENKIIADRIENNIISYINQHELKRKKDNPNIILEKIKKLGYSSMEDFFLGIHRGEYTIANAVDQVFIDHSISKDAIALESMNSAKKTVNNDYKNDILVSGIDNLKVQIASCCLPIPTENIIGYVSKGHGIKVHLVQCPNVVENERTIDVSWNPNMFQKNFYITKIKFFANDQPNLIYDISKALTSTKTAINSIKISNDEKKLLATGTIKVKVQNSDQLSMIMSTLKSLSAIQTVEREMES